MSEARMHILECRSHSEHWVYVALGGATLLAIAAVALTSLRMRIALGVAVASLVATAGLGVVASLVAFDPNPYDVSATQKEILIRERSIGHPAGGAHQEVWDPKFQAARQEKCLMTTARWSSVPLVLGLASFVIAVRRRTRNGSTIVGGR